MGNTKTAISIDKSLFDQVDNLAREMNTSRSRIFALAAADFIERHKNRKLLAAVNAAYEDIPDEEETNLKSKIKSKHFKIVKDQW